MAGQLRAEVGEADRARLSAFSATLVNFLFLLYFDTRAGYGDTGPYAVPGHPDRTLLGFLQWTCEAAAIDGAWDRGALEADPER